MIIIISLVVREKPKMYNNDQLTIEWPADGKYTNENIIKMFDSRVIPAIQKLTQLIE